MLSTQIIWEDIHGHLEDKKKRIIQEIRNYPPPIAGCDAQFNYLLEERDRIFRELSQLEHVLQNSSPQADTIALITTFVQSSASIDAETGQQTQHQLAQLAQA